MGYRLSSSNDPTNSKYPVKIAVFTDLRFTESPAPTGVGKHITQMVQGLARIEGNQVSVLAARDQACKNELRSTSSLSFLASRRLPLPWKAAEALWTLAGGPAVDKYCRGADWVYCPKNDFIPLNHTRLAVTIHGAHELDPQVPQSSDYRSQLNRIRRRISYRRIIGRADLILTVSEFLKQQIINWFGCDEERIEVIGNGVEREYFDVADQPVGVSGRSMDRPYLLCVGGLNDLDGGRLILQVAQVLSRVRPEIQILVAGSQHEREYVALAQTLKNVELLGYVPTARLAPLMRDAQALLFLTKYETFGIAAAEAIAVGAAVITSGGTAVPEIVGDAALYVSDKPQDVVDGILRIAGDAGYIENLRIAGRRRAKNFTWEACVERLMTALNVHS